MANILFAVHRYPPYEGGSEFYVRDMADECLKRNHAVTVLTHQHQGDLNGVKVTDDYNILVQKWDLIVVHGGDVVTQNVLHENAFTINRISPVLYMLIKPSLSVICHNGLKHHRFLGYSTSADTEFLKAIGGMTKARRVRHGIVPATTIKTKTPTKDPSRLVFVSAGGFFPHKAMVPLAEAFEASGPPNGVLHLYGYADGPKPQESDKVKVYLGKSRDEMLQAMADSDGLILNSYEEGFGLVLLEAMANKVPWFARDLAGAHDMARHGTLYYTETELMEILRNYNEDPKKIRDAYNFMMANHSIHDTVNDIEDILLELM